MKRRCILIMSLNKHHSSLEKQAGSAIIIAIFVIIIISLLGAALVSLQRDSAKGTSYEVYAARAYLSAYSAGEVALAKLFPLGETDPDETNCSVASPAKITVTLTSDTGFNGCTADYTCLILSGDSNLPTRYKIDSTAVCKNSQTVTRRKVTVEAVNL